MSVVSIPIMSTGRWEEDMVTINTFITQRAEQFRNAIQQRKWKIKLMLKRIDGRGWGGSLNNIGSQMAESAWMYFF